MLVFSILFYVTNYRKFLMLNTGKASLFLSSTWKSKTTVMQDVLKYQLITFAKKYNVSVWAVFEEYKAYFTARHKKYNFEPTILTFDDLWVLDQHVKHLPKYAVYQLLLTQTPESIRPKN